MGICRDLMGICFKVGTLLVGLVGFLGFAHAVVQSDSVLNLPDGFEMITVAEGLNLPLDFEFMPSGAIMVAEKGVGVDIDGISQLKLVENGTVVAQPVLTLSTNVFWDSGLLAFVLDPDFANNGFLYVWYATGENALGWDGESTLRLSRFTYDFGTRTADSEAIMLELDQWYRFHHGNSLLFDPAGDLLVGIGDIANPSSVQSLSTWVGKILRIRPKPDGTYTIPSDNPFTDDPTARPEIYALGVRNPFRMTQQSSDGTIFVGDVGASTWEEVNLLQAAANYGWDIREGPCPKNEVLPCDPTPPEFTDPIIYYQHGNNGQGSVTGLTFYEGDAFPEEYHNQLFFADYAQSFVRVGDVNSGTHELFADGTTLFGTLDIRYQHGGLYLLNIINGTISYIYYSDSDNLNPTAAIMADVVQGPAPLTVNFTAIASDPDDPVLTYHWDFDDGSPEVITTTNTIVWTFSADNTYNVSLKVTDPRGGESPTVTQPITVYSGEYPTVDLSIKDDVGRTLYHGGDTITYRVNRSTLADLDPITPFTWRIDLHHNVHTHPIVVDYPTIEDTFVVPTDNHDGDADLWYQFIVTMHLLSGQEIVIARAIYPEVVNVTVDSDPRTWLSVNGVERRTPYQLPSIVGVENTLSAPEEINQLGLYEFHEWVWSGGQSADSTITWFAPQQPITYTAIYEFIEGITHLPILEK